MSIYDCPLQLGGSAPVGSKSQAEELQWRRDAIKRLEEYEDLNQEFLREHSKEPRTVAFRYSTGEYKLMNARQRTRADKARAIGGTAGSVTAFVGGILGSLIGLEHGNVLLGAGLSAAISYMVAYFLTAKTCVVWLAHKDRKNIEKENAVLAKHSAWCVAHLKWCNHMHATLQRLEKKAHERDMKKQQFWLDLNGYQFENEVASVFQNMGYIVKAVGGTNDNGIDLEWEENGDLTVVQCKAHAKPLGPATVRELLGARIARGADRALLVTLHGVSSKAERFAVENHVEVLDVRHLVKMAEK